MESAIEVNKKHERAYRHKDCLIGLLKSDNESLKKVVELKFEFLFTEINFI